MSNLICVRCLVWDGYWQVVTIFTHSNIRYIISSLTVLIIRSLDKIMGQVNQSYYKCSIILQKVLENRLVKVERILH